MIPVVEVLRRIAARLRAAGLDDPRREARLILARALDTDLAGLFGHGEVPEAVAAALVERRARHEPLAYITGEREFWSLPFKVSPATLIPRPDSETLIEAALAARPDRGSVRRILDLGTGTGCLLLAALSEYPQAWGIGVDLAPDAASLARLNAAALGMQDRASFIAGSWTDALTGKFDLILANPPYIPNGDIPGLMPEVAGHEPRLALDGGTDGLDAYRALIVRLPAILDTGGIAVFELGEGQDAMVTALAQTAGLATTSRADLVGIPRALIIGAGNVARTGI